MKTSRTLSSLTLMLLFVLFGWAQLSAQSQPTVTNTVASNGYSLKKQVSNSTVPSGVVFTYTIFYTIPAGASSVTITDQVPSSLVIDNVVPGTGCGTPTVTVSGNLVSYALSSVASGCSGTFQINVHFPAGTTCPGTTARNKVCLFGEPQTEMCTDYISTTATANDPFRVSKGVSGLSWNPQNSGCQYIMTEGANVTYKLYVYKTSPYQGNDDGQINLNSAVVTDVLPAGATLVSSTCGVTQSGNTLTWNVGTLNAASPWVWQSCQVVVNYPAGTFPTGTLINNTATLSGINACNQPYSTNSNTTCIEVAAPISSGTFSKGVYLNNKMPGCTGVYYLTTCNNGNTPLTFNVQDVLPAGITVNSVSFYASAPVTASATLVNTSTVSIASGSTGSINWTAPAVSPVASLQVAQTGLAAGSCLQVQIKFTIDNSVAPNTTITNCATLTSSQIANQQKCVSFVTSSPAPDMCLYKQVCSPQVGYQPGDIFRYRLRIQNIGSQDATGFVISDVLDPNLTYVGNQTTYSSTSYNPACGGTGSTPWILPSPTVTGNNLYWTGVNIDAECQDFYYVNCGVYGTQGVTFYFIEFDVQVAPDAASGIVPNNFSTAGGNLTSSETSNTANVVINVTHGTELFKELSTDNSTWGGSVLVAPGSNLWYRLHMTNTGTGALYDVRKVDLLAMNDGGNDWKVMDRTITRGSQFGVSNPTAYAYNVLSTPPVSGTANTMAGNNLSLFNALGVNIGTTTDAWPYTGGGNNVGIGYGATYALASGGSLETTFKVTASPNAQVNQQTCNDFASGGSGKYIINNAIAYTPLTPAASNIVCATVEQGVEECCEQTKVWPSDEDKCCLKIRTECPMKQLQVIVQGGTISNAAWNCTAGLGSYQGQSNYSFIPNGCAPVMDLCFDALPSNTTGVITVNLIFTFNNGEVCERSIQLEGCKPPEPSDCCGDWKLKFKNSFFKKTGIFEYTNPSTKPICSVSIQAAAGLTAGSYSADGGLAQPMTSTSLITLAPPALNSVKFWMSASMWYSSPIVLQVNYCDGTYCLDTLKWKGKIIHHDVDILREAIPNKLYAVQLQPDPNARFAEEVAAMSITLEPTDASRERPYIFAASAGKMEGETLSAEQSCVATTWMSADNAFVTFPTKEDAESCGSAIQKRLALVIGDHQESQSPPILLITYFDRDGNVIATSEVGDYAGGDVTSSTVDAETRSSIATMNIYPNPTADQATFTYTIGRSRSLKVDLYDLNGKRLETIDEGTRGAGHHQLQLYTGHLPPGMYVIRLQSEDAVQSLRLSVVR